MHLDRITRRSLGERIKQRRMQVYYVCKKKFDSATAGGGFDEIEDFINHLNGIISNKTDKNWLNVDYL